jgi:exopolysaccharide production protein ExoQ
MSSSALIDVRSLPPAMADTPSGLPRPEVTWGILVVSLTALLLGALIGSAGAYAFLALWVMLSLPYGRHCLALLTDTRRVIWVLPFLMVASTLWSQSRTDTARASLEYVATVGCALLAASLLKPRAFISALTVCLVITALLSVAIGKQSIDPLTGSSAFVGVFASKNQIAFFTSMMLLAGVALLLDTRQPLPARLLGVVALVLAMPLMVLTRSGTAIVSSVLAILVLVANLIMSRLSRLERAHLLCAAVVTMLPVAILFVVAGDDMKTLLLDSMGKDATLTGRTMLWAHAMQLIPQHPLFGYGYQAFWQRNSVEAESLWYEFHVDGRYGFHFHSTYIETTIELGYIGAAALVATLLGVFAGLIRWSWRVGSVSASFFTALMFCLLTRSFVEVDVFTPFEIGGFTLFVAASYAARAPSEDPIELADHD